MVAKNDITGDAIQTKAASKAYEENYERIFGKKTRKSPDDYQDILSTEECVLEALKDVNESQTS